MVDARDPAQLARREDAVPARALRRVHDDAFGRRLAAEETRQVQVRNETEAAGQDVALPLPAHLRAGQDHPLDALVAERLADPRARPVGDAAERRRVAESLGDPVGLAPEARAESGEPGEGRLLGDPRDPRPRMRKCGRHREEERPGSGHDDAKALEAGPGLAGPVPRRHRRRPEASSREGEEQLAGARREHEALEGDADRQAVARDEQLVRFRRVHHRGDREYRCPRARQAVEPLAGGRGASPRQIWPPGRACSSRSKVRAPASAAWTAAAIPAGPPPTTTTSAPRGASVATGAEGIFVALWYSLASTQPANPEGAASRASLLGRPDSPPFPSRTVSRHARRWGSSSIATRHSKQVPIAQSGPRASPLTDVRTARRPAFHSATRRLVPPPPRRGVRRS